MFFKEKRRNDSVCGFIGKGITLSGKLNFYGTVRIDGEFEGEIDAEGDLIVGEEARVKAKINVSSIVIRGEVRGSIEAKQRVDIQMPGKVIGDIKTSKLVIGEGALFEGKCIMDRKSKNVPVEIKSFREAKKAEV